MKPTKLEQTKADRDHQKEQQQTYWANRMKSSKIKKMTQGAQNIFKVIKDRMKWGEKSMRKNRWWNKKRAWNKELDIKQSKSK